MKRQILISSLILLFIQTLASAVPARPLPFETEQPDGTKIMLRVKGDEWHHWLEDTEGYLVTKQPTGHYMYA